MNWNRLKRASVCGVSASAPVASACSSQRDSGRPLGEVKEKVEAAAGVNQLANDAHDCAKIGVGRCFGYRYALKVWV